MRGRIKVGTAIFQDHHFGRWPNCCPPQSEYDGEAYQYIAKDPDMLFDVERKSGSWDCRADGYGNLASMGKYGNGSIFVRSEDGVEIVEDA